MRKRILALITTMILLISSTITVFAEQNMTIYLNGIDLSKDSDGFLTENSTLDKIEQYILMGEDDRFSRFHSASNILFFTETYELILSGTKNLRETGINDGDTLRIVNEDEVVLVQYLGKTYPSHSNSDKVMDIKIGFLTEIDGATKDRLGLSEVQLLDLELYTPEGNLLGNEDAVAKGSTVLLSVKNVSTEEFIDTNINNDTILKEINATYNEIESETIYSVDITWGAMNFEYTSENSYDPDSHTNNSVETWECSNNTITVKNHSNADVEVDFGFIKDTNYFSDGSLEFSANASDIKNNTVASLTNNIIILDSAEGKDVNNAPEITVTATPSGKLSSSLPDGDEVRLGAITVSIKQVN